MKICKLNLFIFCLILAHCISEHSTIISTFNDGPKIDDSGLSDSLKNLYKIDATLLAVREIWEINNSYCDSIEIPDKMIKFYYHRLIAIYNDSIIPATDSVTTLFPIHTRDSLKLTSICIAFDNSFSWVDSFINTGNTKFNTSFDSLIQKYQLRILHNLSIINVVVFHSDKPLNMRALGERFLKIPGIRYTHPDAALDGNDITAIRNSSNVLFTFSLGWGDCPNGCIWRRFWDIKVQDDYSIVYLGSYGASLKDWVHW